ncbi:MAG: hypothetical protein ISS33_05185 [Candidatus Omnitrophica bacterium]|nr:hypothetical protein [Candidatus Omnitrophota bacterium]
MGLKDREQIKVKHKVKRRKKRKCLTKKGLNPDDFYHGRFYVGQKEAV